MITLWRIFVASWKNVARNAWIGLATVFVFSMALLSVNVLVGVNALLDQMLTVLEDRIDVTVSFKPAAPAAVVDQARFYLASLSQVKDVQFISADDVLKQFRERHVNDAKVLSALEELSANPMGAQLTVRAKNVDDYPFLLEAIQNPQYRDFIEPPTYNDHREAILRVQEAARSIRIVGAILIAIFALFGLLIAFNAIRVAIYTQREEIGIMRLVGASSLYIRMPFILEGIWLALFSLVVSVCAVWGVLTWIEPAAGSLFEGFGFNSGLRAFFWAQAPLILAVEAGSLLLVVIMVSWAAAGRYIRR